MIAQAIRMVAALLIASTALWSVNTRAEIISEYPHLKKYLYSEHDSSFRFGFGLTPIRIMKSKAGFALNIFQIHFQSGWLDWEVFNASFGTTISGEPTSKVN